MATQKDWKGFYNVLKEVDFKEDEFATIIIAFIELKYPDSIPINFMDTDDCQEILYALFNLFEHIKRIQIANRILIDICT
ncbi:MAG: hypothetical protein GXO79_10570 [Chlorobi bacterium]|nr:hypothetical protein [Chlorobiota bacterium]